MLEGLDDVPWGYLHHGYGRADNIPGMLRALAAGDPEVLDAMVCAEYGLVSNAEVFSATAAAVPFLVELATYAQVRGRADILREAVMAAVCEGKKVDRPHGVRRRMSSEADRLVELLDDPDAGVRMMAATALGHCDPPARSAAPALDAHRQTEPDPAARAALIASAVACDPTSGREWVQQAYRDPSAPVRAAAVYATAVNGLPWTPQTTAALAGCWDGGDPLESEQLWAWDYPSWTFSVLDHLTLDTVRIVLSTLMSLPATATRRAAFNAWGYFRDITLAGRTALDRQLNGLADDGDQSSQEL